MHALDSIASNTSRNLTSLAATYGILLSFVIATKMDIAFQSWAFYVWAGLIVSIIVRSLWASDRLSGLAYLSSINWEQKIGFLLYSKSFLKHSTFIFIAIIAFTPAFTLVNPQDEHIEDKYTYLGDLLLLTVALSVISVTIFFLFVATFIPETLRIYYVWILFALVSVTLFLTNSPLDPIKIKVFSDLNKFIVPFITIPILFAVLVS
jgi:hypothetical protein